MIGVGDRTDNPKLAHLALSHRRGATGHLSATGDKAFSPATLGESRARVAAISCDPAQSYRAPALHPMRNVLDAGSG